MARYLYDCDMIYALCKYFITMFLSWYCDIANSTQWSLLTVQLVWKVKTFKTLCFHWTHRSVSGCNTRTIPCHILALTRGSDGTSQSDQATSLTPFPVIPPSEKATLGGERQPAGARGEGEQREEAAESHQRGAAVAPPDGRAQPSDVPQLLATPPTLLRTRFSRSATLLPSVTLSPSLSGIAPITLIILSATRSPCLHLSIHFIDCVEFCPGLKWDFHSDAKPPKGNRTTDLKDWRTLSPRLLFFQIVEFTVPLDRAEVLRRRSGPDPRPLTARPGQEAQCLISAFPPPCSPAAASSPRAQDVPGATELEH